MGRFYYEDSGEPWREDGLLRRFVPGVKAGTERQHAPQRRLKLETRKSQKPRAVDLGMGYGRNAIWLAEQGYEVEGWERDGRYVGEARREWRRRREEAGAEHLFRASGEHRLRTGSLAVKRGDFTKGKWRGPYEVVVASAVLHMLPRRAALRTLQRMRRALARGGRIFLRVKLTDDPVFRRLRKDPRWEPMRGERNTVQFRGQGRPTGLAGPAGTPMSVVQSRLTRTEVRAALQGLRVLRWKERVLRSEWGDGESVTHRVAEIVAERV